MKLTILIAPLFLSGCCIGDGCTTRDSIEMVRAEKRIQLFNDCMELASKNARAGDDDVSDLVEACDSRAYYTANQLVK